MAGGSSLLGLIPLIAAGFLFSLLCYRTRFHLATSDGQRLFFVCAIPGLLLGMFAWPLWAWAHRLIPEISRDWLDQAFQGLPIGAFLTAFVLSVVAAWSINLFDLVRWKWTAAGQAQSTRDWCFHRFINGYGSPIQKLQLDAMTSGRDVLVTLKSRKVYCGLIIGIAPLAGPSGQFLQLVPRFSAYRNKDSLAIEGRLDYQVLNLWNVISARAELQGLLERSINQAGILAKPNATDAASRMSDLDAFIAEARKRSPGFDFDSFDIRMWSKVIPTDQIESISYWDESAYDSWFAPKTPVSAHGDSRTPIFTD